MRKRLRIAAAAIAMLTLALLAAMAYMLWQPGIDDILLKLKGMRTSADILNEHGDRVRPTWRASFAAVDAPYPPPALTMIGLKEERLLELWTEHDRTPRLVHTYPILGASGGPGPKLREGDLQVPEGIYGIEYLNPNSGHHLSMKVNYPNKFDLARATEEMRIELGGDIFIHGGSASIGCLAIGNESIEELFVLVADTGIENIRVILAPHDFRNKPPQADEDEWLARLYAQISAELQRYAKPAA